MHPHCTYYLSAKRLRMSEHWARCRMSMMSVEISAVLPQKAEPRKVWVQGKEELRVLQA